MKSYALFIPALAAAAVALPGATASTASSDVAGEDLVRPTVNMEKAVQAAQIDPRRADDTLTPGARNSVLLVEQALEDEDLLAEQWVDGYFGSKTTTAYSEYQESLGYEGLAANGLPGQTSLTSLGEGRFEVTAPLTPGSRVEREVGMVVNTRTDEMLDAAEERFDGPIELTQGSYNTGGDPTSAGTHDGGGVVDISILDLPQARRIDLITTLRDVGFAAWIRTPEQGNWPFHIHAVAISDTDLSRPAQHQVGDYYLGLNGLANQAADDGPRVQISTWEHYEFNK